MRLGAKISRRLFGAFKRIRRRFIPRADAAEKTILLILGCQRCGTTLMQNILDRDIRSSIYGEFSKLSSRDRENRIRLNPLQEVRQALDADRADLIVLKPLVESQNALKLLDAFDNARVLWMYRDFRDSAVSGISTFGRDSGIYDLRCVVDNRAGDWRAEGLPEELRAIASKHFSPDMPPHDAAALFWFIRNSWFFELDLDSNRRVKLCRYGDLVTQPADVLRSIYEFIGHKFPGDKLLPRIHQTSVDRGAELELSEDVQTICTGLLGRLDKARAD